jgi:hypothetical protein
MPKDPRLTTETRPGLTVKKNDTPGKAKGPPAHSFTIDEIQNRAEAISPLLKELLDFRPPPHWGLND